jgi:hypothetical protein
MWLNKSNKTQAYHLKPLGQFSLIPQRIERWYHSYQKCTLPLSQGIFHLSCHTSVRPKAGWSTREVRLKYKRSQATYLLIIFYFYFYIDASSSFGEGRACSFRLKIEKQVLPGLLLLTGLRSCLRPKATSTDEVVAGWLRSKHVFVRQAKK